MKPAPTILISTLLFATCTWGQTPGPALVDLTAVRHKPSEVTTKAGAKALAGKVELVDGQFGKACKFSFIESAGPQTFVAWVNPKDDWDQYEGFSFWVKGDGSKGCGGLEFIDAENFGLRYGYCFPIRSTQWEKVNVPWSDLVPELSGPPVDAQHGYAPSRFRNLWVGKWFYWREWPACSFTIERMSLEKAHPREAVDAEKVPHPGTARVLAKLKARQPVTIVTMGDSLSDKRHWANQQKLWSEILVRRLKETYGGKVTLVNPAIGGTTLSQNVVLIPRWLQDALRRTWCWSGSAAMTGRTASAGRGTRSICGWPSIGFGATKGRADILLMTTLPGLRTWETTAELSKAAHTVACECKTGFVDAATAFHKAGSAEEAMKRQYWGWDGVHLGPAGHELIADAVARGIESEGLADLKTAADAYWMKATVQAVAEGETLLCSFEPGQDMLVANTGGEVVREHATDGQCACASRAGRGTIRRFPWKTADPCGWRRRMPASSSTSSIPSPRTLRWVS